MTDRIAAALVPQVLGWKQTGTWFLDEPEWCAEVPVWQRPESPVVTIHGPTPDDMLAWLVAKNFTSFHFGVQGGGFYVDWGDDSTHASTLHEALSAAVLAVAEREEPGHE